MTTVFLDTSYIIALETADDINHDLTLKHWHFIQKLPRLVITSYVFDEIITFFNSRNRHAKAVETGERLLPWSISSVCPCR